jgi:hypothetical protein
MKYRGGCGQQIKGTRSLAAPLTRRLPSVGSVEVELSFPKVMKSTFALLPLENFFCYNDIVEKYNSIFLKIANIKLTDFLKLFIFYYACK